MAFGHAPGLPGGQHFGNGAWYLCGEHRHPKAVGNPLGQLIAGGQTCLWPKH